MTGAASELGLKGNRRTVLKFWIPLCGFLIPGTGFRILSQWNSDSWFQSLVGFRNPSVESRFQHQDSGFHKQTFIRFRNPDYLTWALHEATDECVDIDLPKSLELQMTPASRTGPGVKETSWTHSLSLDSFPRHLTFSSHWNPIALIPLGLKI